MNKNLKIVIFMLLFIIVFLLGMLLGMQIQGNGIKQEPTSGHAVRQEPRLMGKQGEIQTIRMMLRPMILLRTILRMTL